MKRKAVDWEYDVEPLSSAQRRELLRRVRDLDDPTRYMITSRLFEGSRMQLYYNVADDVWSTSQADGALFKRRRSAMAILRLLGSRARIIKVFLKRGKIRNAKVTPNRRLERTGRNPARHTRASAIAGPLDLSSRGSPLSV